jgi:iron complex outermembrane receptor protein
MTTGAHARIWRATLAVGPAIATLALRQPADAQVQSRPDPPTPFSVSEVVVVAPTPLPGSGVDRDKSPGLVQVLTSADIASAGTPDALRSLNEQVGAVNLDSAAGNPYQPTLFYHGFEASPLQGVSQGLAVYVDGVRFNQPFGDTVNWDLIPNIAIQTMTLEDSNPAFGLNALGGALNLHMKSGFDYHGAEADLSGGSFGARQGEFQYGAAYGNTALYVAADAIHQDGWRDLQSTDISNVYGDFRWRGDAAEIHLSGSWANTALNGPGTAPVELLAVDPRAQFTAPNAIQNNDWGATLRGDFKLGADLSLTAEAYYSAFREAVENGNSANDTPCNDGSGQLCGDSGPSTTVGGATIPAFLGPNPLAYSELDEQLTKTRSYGASAQLVSTASLFGLSNSGVLGASFDGAKTNFGAISFIGGITPVSRVFVGPGVVIDEPGDNVPVEVAITNADSAVFFTDTLDLTSRLSATASARYNDVEVDLHDQLGGDLTGDHHYSRLNPAIGGSYRVTSWLTAYAGYSEANRAPTPAELSCAGPNDSCSLANFFVGDPNLKQVIAHTVEAGLRGRTPLFDGSLSYNLGLYRTDLSDDIVFINSVTLGRAFFTNIGGTRRQGVDAEVRFKDERWSAYVAYSHTDATYRSGFVESAGSNPDGDVNGNLTITPGDHLPGIPADQVKLGLTFKPTDKLSVGATAVGQSGSYLFGDEANLTPQLPGFFVLNFNASYQATANIELFAHVDNVTDARYYTFGTFSPTTSVFLAQAPNATNPRSYSLAAPVGAFGGVSVSF